jgi:hypothetical protein
VNAAVQYGGETLERACAVGGSLKHPGPHSLINASALLAVLRQLPILPVELTGGTGGRVIADHLRVRRLGVPKNRIAQGVLPLRAGEQDYLGSCSRIVRRQIRRARLSGVECSRLTSDEQRWLVIRQLTPQVPGMPRWVDRLPGRFSDDWWVAREATGRPVGFAIVVADTRWAMLDLLISLEHPARYLLHTEIVTDLGKAGVRYLMTDSPTVLRMDRHVRQFQRVLGYRVAHLALQR